MIERLHPHRSGARTGRRAAPPIPVPPPRRRRRAEAPSILGFPAEVDPDDDRLGVRPAAGGGAEPDVRLVVHRRPDPVAGAALVLAGVAANVSLWVPWVADDGATGMSLVRRGIGLAGSGMRELLASGLWQPVTVVLGAGLLVLLAMLLFVPAHTHRLVGVLALLVALMVTAAVTTLLAGGDWIAARFDLGLWAGAAVAGFGLLGALKAMLTLPVVTAVARGSAAEVGSPVDVDDRAAGEPGLR